MAGLLHPTWKSEMTPEQLKQWREKRGLSQSQAALTLNDLSVRTWQDWEAGRRNPPDYLSLALEAVDARLKRKRT